MAVAVQFTQALLNISTGVLLPANTAVTVTDMTAADPTTTTPVRMFADVTGAAAASSNVAHTDAAGNLTVFLDPAGSDGTGRYRFTPAGLSTQIYQVPPRDSALAHLASANTFRSPQSFSQHPYVNGSGHFDPMHPDFGAYGDGSSHDDTSAVQAALNAIDPTVGGVVDLRHAPAGYFKAGYLKPKNNTTILGRGGLYNYTISYNGPAGIQTKTTGAVTPLSVRTFMTSPTTLTGTYVLPVVSTSGFPSSGQVVVPTQFGPQLVSYTGVTGTSFTGCTGGSGTTLTTTVATAVEPAFTLTVSSTTGAAASGVLHVLNAWQVPCFVPYVSKDATHFYGCTGGVAFPNTPTVAAIPSGAQVTTLVRCFDLFNVYGVHFVGVTVNGAMTVGVEAWVSDSDNSALNTHNTWDDWGVFNSLSGIRFGTDQANSYQLDKQHVGRGQVYNVGYGLHYMSDNTQSGDVGPELTMQLVNKGIWVEQGGFFDVHPTDYGGGITNFAGTILPNQPVMVDFTGAHNGVDLRYTEAEDGRASGRNVTDLVTTSGSNTVSSATANFKGMNTTLTSPITLPFTGTANVASTAGVTAGSSGTAVVEGPNGTIYLNYSTCTATTLTVTGTSAYAGGSNTGTIPAGSQVTSGDIGGSLWAVGVAPGAIINQVISTTQVALTQGLGGPAANSWQSGTSQPAYIWTGLGGGATLHMRVGFMAAGDSAQAISVSHGITGAPIDIQTSVTIRSTDNAFYGPVVLSGLSPVWTTEYTDYWAPLGAPAWPSSGPGPWVTYGGQWGPPGIRGRATQAWNPGAIAAGGVAVTALAVTASQGDRCQVQFDGAVDMLMVEGQVVATNVVRVYATNKGGSTITPAAGTVTVIVFKGGYQ